MNDHYFIADKSVLGSCVYLVDVMYSLRFWYSSRPGKIREFTKLRVLENSLSFFQLCPRFALKRSLRIVSSRGRSLTRCPVVSHAVPHAHPSISRPLNRAAALPYLRAPRSSLLALLCCFASLTARCCFASLRAPRSLLLARRSFAAPRPPAPFGHESCRRKLHGGCRA